MACLTAAACSTEPQGTLEITLDPLAKITSATSVTIGGGVTRTPVKTTTIVVRASGGLGTPVDTVRGGRFALKIDLNTNAQNQLALTASDATGAASPAVNVSIRQDNQPPTVVQTTPADTADNVARNTPIQLKMSEPVVVAAGGGIRMTRQGAPVSGAASLSADSLTLTFVPSAQLSPNAIYRIAVSGVSDVANNASTSPLTTCFVTAVTGATASLSVSDSINDTFYGGDTTRNTLARPDLVGARFAREGTLFSGVFRFVGPRTFSRVANNRAAVFLDLDVDQDSTTGFVTIKDFLFRQSFPTYSSGTRAEYLIGLEPLSELGDSAYVGKWVPPADSLEFEPVAAFVPDVCGAAMAFVVPFSVLGNDDGKMNAVAVALASSTTALFADPLPTRGRLTLNLASPTGPVAGMEWPVAPAPATRVLRPRIPIRRLKT